VVTSTTHKTLRGPRGGIILAQENEAIEKRLNSLVFPGTQGGPLMHVIAAKAVAFKEALEPGFVEYQQQVVVNAKAMAAVMMEREYTGKDAEEALGRAFITVNKNTVPGEPRSPFVTSGLRLGTPAVTTRGFDQNDCSELAGIICDVLDHVGDTAVEDNAREAATALCHRHPVYHR